MRKKARVDSNQKEIVEALKKIGCSVVSLAPMGRGVPDLLVGYKGHNYLLEIKDGTLPPSKQKLTEDEQKFFDSWLGQRAIVRTSEEAIKVIRRFK